MTIDTKGFTPNPDITPAELTEMRKKELDNVIVARVGSGH